MYTREGFHTNYIHSKYKTWMLSGTSPSRGRGKRAARPPADWRREGASSASLMAGAGPEGRRDRGGGAVPRVWHQGEIEAEVRQNLHCGIGAEQHGAGSHGGCLSGRAASSRGGGRSGRVLVSGRRSGREGELRRSGIAFSQAHSGDAEPIPYSGGTINYPGPCALRC